MKFKRKLNHIRQKKQLRNGSMPSVPCFSSAKRRDVHLKTREAGSSSFSWGSSCRDSMSVISSFPRMTLICHVVIVAIELSFWAAKSACNTFLLMKIPERDGQTLGRRQKRMIEWWRKEIPSLKRIEGKMRVERIQGTKMMNSANGYNIVISAASNSVDLD